MRNPNKLHQVLAVTVCVAGLAGCESLQASLAGSLGRGIDKPAGRELAHKVAPPPVTVKTEQRGGGFCRTMTALGWEKFQPPEAMIAATPDREANILADTLDHGVAKCGWRPPG